MGRRSTLAYLAIDAGECQNMKAQELEKQTFVPNSPSAVL